MFGERLLNINIHNRKSFSFLSRYFTAPYLSPTPTPEIEMTPIDLWCGLRPLLYCLLTIALYPTAQSFQSQLPVLARYDSDIPNCNLDR